MREQKRDRLNSPLLPLDISFERPQSADLPFAYKHSTISSTFSAVYSEWNRQP